MGIHDMGWKERPIFGKIRYMNYNGCLRKFKVKEFVAKWEGGSGGSKRAVDNGNGNGNGNSSSSSSSSKKKQKK